MEPSSSSSPSASAKATASLKTTWSLPPTLTPRQVLPDRWTDPVVLNDSLAGKETDPSRMAIFLCLLEDKPHLHPSLSALHKHRFQAHGIPLPADPTKDLPSPPNPPNPPDPPNTLNPLDPSDVADGPDDRGGPAGGADRLEQTWLSWRFTEEEEARRKAYLPLA